jgi:uncharacterized membrane protein HdeD (DUF308 family)
MVSDQSAIQPAESRRVAQPGEASMYDNSSWSMADDDRHGLRRIWGWLVGLGVALIALGFAAIAWPAVATFATVTVFGVLLVVGGLVELVSMIWVRRWGGFFHHLLSGLLYLFLGAVLLDRPGLGAAGYTLLLAVFFVASGVTRAVYAIGHQGPGRGWTILSGVISFLLGVMIWRDLPEAALWVIGTFVGIELVFNGMTWLMLGLAARKLPEPVGNRLSEPVAHV